MHHKEHPVLEEKLAQFKQRFWEHRIPSNTKQAKDIEDFLRETFTAGQKVGYMAAVGEAKETLEGMISLIPTSEGEKRNKVINEAIKALSSLEANQTKP